MTGTLSDRRRRTRRVLVPAVVLAAAVWASLIAPGAFALDRGAVAAGEVWRLWTGHLVHWSSDHLLWDGLTFLVLAWLLARLASRGLLWLLAVGAPLTSAGVLLLQPRLQLYGGLSGLDVALWMAVCLVVVRRSQDRPTRVAAAIALLGGAAKVATEIATGHAVLVGGGVTLVPAAHVVGGLVGLGVAAIECARRAVAAPEARPRCVEFASPCSRIPNGVGQSGRRDAGWRPGRAGRRSISRSRSRCQSTAGGTRRRVACS